MTDQQSLDDIAALLARYPGVTSARGFFPKRDDITHLRFRCNDFTSLKRIAWCAVAANITISLGDPEGQLCYESDTAIDCPFDIAIADGDDPDAPPTQTQLFGIYLARNLRRHKLIDDELANQLQHGWNARPA